MKPYLGYVIGIIVLISCWYYLDNTALSGDAHPHTHPHPTNQTNKTDQTYQTNKQDTFYPVSNYIEYKKNRRKRGHAKTEAPEMMALLERERRTPNDLAAPAYPANYKIKALRQAKSAQARSRQKNSFEFIERGPANVAGRTRALLVLPGDPDQLTWLAASVSGGIWKTEDGGQTWIDKTPDLPNLGTSTLAMSAADPNIIYAGTGEHFTNDIDGSGMFKSEDQGETWTQIVAEGDYPAFANVSRIIVDPADADVVIASTRNGVFEDSLYAAIYKSIDGGETWEAKILSTDQRYDDLAYNPQNFNTMYAAVQRTGVLKSTDGGETWISKSKGLQVTGRIEIATSPLDTNYVWGMAQGEQTNTGSDLYLSKDGGESWKLASEENGNAIDYLGGQGWFDNVIEPHPFSKDVAYVGGVNLFKVKVSPSEITDVLYDIRDGGAFDFLDFINGISIGGGILEGNVPAEDVVSVELRFGEGTQMAHRFSVNGRGSGVPARDYEYLDLVEIPFQAWDVTNDRQLMVSFRDQHEDSTWTLKERMLSNNTQQDSREYIFVHNVTYADTVNADIAVDGGHEFQQLYFMWPVLRAGQQFDPNIDFPRSFRIIAETTTIFGGTTTVISDAYDDFDGQNGFGGELFANNQGNHPDQHSLRSIIIDSSLKLFRLLITNDGGVYVTNTARDPGVADGSIKYAGFRYNTTQFYGADKMPGADRYIGGMQDNSTWVSPGNESANAQSLYDFAFGGDGFEAIWNNRDPDQILGSVQFNSFRRSTDGGETWSFATGGINDNGPFISRLANSRALPERIFAVGSTGVHVSTDFGASWTTTPVINPFWSFNNGIDIEVSPANPKVVATGGALDDNNRIFVSTDAGQSFSPTNYYDAVEMGTMSGLAMDPVRDSTIYALFSFSGRPKVLKSDDLGKNWEDISGFEEGNGTSNNGFPDVAVYSLLVFPNEPSRIWVGTEIGLVQSEDGGESWALLESNLPSVVIFDMKIQDDQVVLATYGRGIWTATIEGIRQNYIFPPAITDLSVSPTGTTELTFDIASEFDSIRIFVEGQKIATIGGRITAGELIYGLQNLGLEDGTYEFFATGFKDNAAYESFGFKASLFKPLPATDQYFNDFSTDSLSNDFIGEGFSIREEFGFDDPAIHTDHNYLDRMTVTYLLKRPIIVREDQFFRYKDVAIIELGEPGVPYGSQDFFDYVVVEGSKDGKTWMDLADGYDSSSNSLWEFSYTNNQNGDASMFVDHEIDLNDVFEINDSIFIRFKLFADSFVNGWGWAIDDVAVELESTTPTLDPVFEGIQVFPNPTSDFFQVYLPEASSDYAIIINDLTGQSIYKRTSSNVNRNLQIDTGSFQPGIYLLQVLSEGKAVWSEHVVVVR